MKPQRSSGVELVDEDEGDGFAPLFDYRETLGPAPTLLSDDSDEEDLVITSGPRPLRPEVSPAQEPPPPVPQRVAAPIISFEDDDDDDDDWMMPAPAQLPSTPPGLGSDTLQALRLNREELMTVHERSTPEAIARIEDQARMQAQERPGLVELPLLSNTPSSSKAHGKSPMIETEEKEKILIKVLDKYGDIQPIRIFMTDKFERLFRAYADASNLSLTNLIFRFDGEELAPDSTPKHHAMEDGELIEVYERF